MKPKRILIKLSGELLKGETEFGYDHEFIDALCDEIAKAHETNPEIAIVVGGGNILRGHQIESFGVDRATADYMGMLATIMNGLLLQSVLEKKGLYTRVMSAIEVNRICEQYIRRRAIRHLEKKRVVIFVGGTGNPFFTTDTAATLRAAEIGADIVIKGTKVDGIFTADPEKEMAQKLDQVSYLDCVKQGLRVMDLTAVTLSMDYSIPIVVLNLKERGNLLKFLKGEKIGSLISS
ncbi:MAG: UMP kinase [Deltaproteobacteria bacterium]|nr:UMP kinase [Deltaproteobacteria bacterium]